MGIVDGSGSNEEKKREDKNKRNGDREEGLLNKGQRASAHPNYRCVVSMIRNDAAGKSGGLFSHREAKQPEPQKKRKRCLPKGRGYWACVCLVCVETDNDSLGTSGIWKTKERAGCEV